MLLPGPDHPITITPTKGRVTVTLGDAVIATTDRALSLAEADYPVAQYLPLEDVDRSVLEPSATVTTCPYKGDASYYTISAGGTTLPDAVWSYRTPHDAVAEIAGYVAFYPDKVQVTVTP